MAEINLENEKFLTLKLSWHWIGSHHSHGIRSDWLSRKARCVQIRTFCGLTDGRAEKRDIIRRNIVWDGLY